MLLSACKGKVVTVVYGTTILSGAVYCGIAGDTAVFVRGIGCTSNAPPLGAGIAPQGNRQPVPATKYEVHLIKPDDITSMQMDLGLVISKSEEASAGSAVEAALKTLGINIGA